MATIATAPRAAAQANGAAAIADSDTTMRGQAIALLQGADTLPWLSEERIALVSRALRVIHSEFHRLADIESDDGGAMVVYIADSAYKSILASSGARRPEGDALSSHTEIRHTGIPALDSLDAKYGVKRAMIWDMGFAAILTLEFARPVNVPVIRAEYQRIPQVRLAMNPWGRGTMWVELIDKGRQLDFAFARGGGDCPSGCTVWDYYYVAYDTLTRTATMEHEVPRNWPPTVQPRSSNPISYWDVPSRLSTDPYPSLDSLLAGTRDDRWWYRSHAVSVLGMLLGPTLGPWRGGDQSPEQFAMLKHAAWARRQEAYTALFDRLDDQDPNVAREALGQLRSVTRQHYGNDAVGLGQWRLWLRDVGKYPSPLEIRFINVGPSDAILIRQGPHAALIDAGPASGSIVEKLHALEVDSLQLLLTTLNRPDRVGAAAAIRSAIPVTTFIDNVHSRRRAVAFGDTRIEIIPPLPRDSASHINGSMVVRVTRGSFQALLTGDVTSVELDSLVVRATLGRVKVLQAPQHSDSTNATPWLRRLLPDIVVMSSANENALIGALRDYESLERAITSTRREGDVAVIVNEDGTYSVQAASGPIR